MKNERFALESKLMMEKLNKLASEKGLSYMRIAIITGLKTANICSILNGKYSPSLDNLINIATAIGYHIEFKEINL